MDHQEVDSLDTKISLLSDGIRKVIEKGAPRLVRVSYAADGMPHKGDRCPHLAYTWESCDACTVEYLASVLEDAGC